VFPCHKREGTVPRGSATDLPDVPVIYGDGKMKSEIMTAASVSDGNLFERMREPQSLLFRFFEEIV